MGKKRKKHDVESFLRMDRRDESNEEKLFSTFVIKRTIDTQRKNLVFYWTSCLCPALEKRRKGRKKRALQITAEARWKFFKALSKEE